jgi:hypothetical protein
MKTLFVKSFVHLKVVSNVVIQLHLQNNNANIVKNKCMLMMKVNANNVKMDVNNVMVYMNVKNVMSKVGT